jgi:hypothetical protein
MICQVFIGKCLSYTRVSVQLNDKYKTSYCFSLLITFLLPYECLDVLVTGQFYVQSETVSS